MARRNLISSECSVLYHVTHISRLDSILSKGLSPEEAQQHSNDGHAYAAHFDGKPAVFLCTFKELPRTKFMVSNAHDIRDIDQLLVLEISTEGLVEGFFDIDWSSHAANFLGEVERNDISDEEFMSVFRRSGYLVIFNVIDPTRLKVVPALTGGFLGD